MADYINGVATADAFPAVLSSGGIVPAGGTVFGPDPSTDTIVFDVGNNPVYMRAWRLEEDGKYTLEPEPGQLIAASLGNVLQRCAGAMWRSAIAGSPATIIAKRYLLADHSLTPGIAFTGVVSGGGGISPPPTTPQVIIQHNGGAAGTEQALNLIDASSVGNPAASPLVWTALDNPAATRVDVTPVVKLGVQHGGASQVNEPIINLIDSAVAALPGIPGLVWTIADNAGANRVDITPVLAAGPLLVTHDQKTTDTTINTTTEGTAVTIITTTSKTYVNQPVLISFFSPAVFLAAVAVPEVAFVLLRDSTVLCQWADIQDSNDAVAANAHHPTFLQFRDTPPAGAHTYTIKAFEGGGTATVKAGAGGSGTFPPAFLRVVYDV